MDSPSLVERLRNTRLLSSRNQMALQNEAAARIEVLEAALTKIARGKFDGLEVQHYTARENRTIARTALQKDHPHG